MSSDRLVLAIDNSLDFLNLVLARQGSLLEERRSRAKGHSSEVLSVKIGRMLEDQGYRPSDITGLVVTLGPGSFTGVRVGLAFCKGLSAGLGVPLAGVPTPDALVMPFRFMEGHFLCPLIDAKKGEAFFALYKVSGGKIHRLGDIVSSTPADLPSRLQFPCICFGTGVTLCRPVLEGMKGVRLVETGFQQVSGEALVLVGLTKLEEGPEAPQPIYGRRSEAEIKFRVDVS